MNSLRSLRLGGEAQETHEINHRDTESTEKDSFDEVFARSAVLRLLLKPPFSVLSVSLW